MRLNTLRLNRAVSVVLFVLLLSAVVMTKALAQSFTVGDLIYSPMWGDEVEVIGHVEGTAATGELVIPETVTYEGNDYVVTSIVDYAFYNCHGFTGNLVIPNSVTYIGSNAFESCSGFNGNLVIPNSVSYIGEYAFYQCTGFSIVEYNATYCDDLWWSAFEGCGGVLIIGENVERIPAYMFQGAAFTGNLVISNSVTYIGYNAFESCSGFNGNLVIPNSVSYIGEYAFYQCTGFSIVEYNATYCDDLWWSAFEGCGGTLIIGENVERIPAHMFEWAMFSLFLSHAEIPPTVGSYAFNNIDHDIPVYVPCGSLGDYQNADGWNEFTKIFECLDIKVITVAVTPSNSGTVTGAGGYETGTTCTLTAIADLGYKFIHWTEDGTVVSTDATYTFVVTEDRNLVAHFDPTTNILSIGDYTGAEGEILTIDINLANEDEVAGFGFDINIPESMTYVEGSLVKGVRCGPNHYIVGQLVDNGTALRVLCYSATNISGNDGTIASFQFLLGEAGIYELNLENFFIATRYGYILSCSVVGGTLTVTGDQSVTYNITATVNPAGAGTVTGSGSYEEGETATLTAIANAGYEFTNWTECGNVVSTSSTYSFTVTSDRALVACYFVGMSQCNPPRDLQGTTTKNKVVLSWTAPAQQGDEEILSWSDTELSSGIGLGGTTEFNCLHKFLATELSNYVGWQVTKIAFTPYQSGTFTVKVWKGTGANPSGNPMLTQSVPNPTLQSMNVIVLTSPFTIEANQTYWFGYGAAAPSSTEYPAGTDAGPAVSGKGDIVGWGSNWTTLTANNLDYNFIIQTTVVNAKGEEKVLAIDKGGAVASYNVYRNGGLIGNTVAETYTDTGLEMETTYNYCVEAVWTDGCVSEQICGDFTTQGMTCTPPETVSVSTTLDAMNISWTAPYIPSSEEWLTWAGDPDFSNGIGTGSATTFSVAHRFQVAEIAPYAGYELTKVRFVPNESACTYSVRVWVGGTSGTNPGSMVVNQEVPAEEITLNAWNEITLDTPVSITGAEEVWFGYFVNTTTGYPAGVDNGPALTGKGDLMHFGGSWTTLYDLGLDYNWSIQGFVQNEGKDVYLNSPVTSNDETKGNIEDLRAAPTRIFRAAPVKGYRDAVASYNIYVDGDLMGSVDGNTFEYSVDGFEDGKYNVCVTAVYDNGCESPPTCANAEMITYEVIVAANPVEGGTVTGAGIYDYGSTVTAVATANDGYTFINWTEGNAVVSQNASYSFTVTSDRNLVANFTEASTNMLILSNESGADGSTVTMSVDMINIEDIAGFQFDILMNEHISYVAGSAALTDRATPNHILIAQLINDGAILRLLCYTVPAANFVGNSGAVVTFDLVITGEAGVTYTVDLDNPIISTMQGQTPEVIAIDGSVTIIPSGSPFYTITATANPAEGGTVIGAGTYEEGDTCTLIATPNEDFIFINWTKNDSIVSTNATYSFTVTESGNYVAHFTRLLPELHVTGISHSVMAGGQQATISWTVQNDGTAPTPNGATWNDYVWLSVESCVNTNFGGSLLLLGTFESISVLNVGESYTQTQTFDIPIDISGDYYLFVLTDVYDAWLINWENNTVPNPYNPPPYISCYSRYNGVIYELTEYEHGNNSSGYYNDNFFYELVDIEVPLVPDLQVTSIIPPDNFFSGTNIHVLATISNLGEVTTPNANWTDALYFSQEPDFNTATCLATVAHSGALAVDSSYQVTFTGHIPLTIFGEAYFFVKTDIYEQVYEHINNHNNMTMSYPVNIILTPPADLEPSELVVPVAVSTAENLSYSFMVTNVGAGNPNVTSWVDKVYISTEDTFGTNAILLNTHHHYGNLAPTAYYSVNGSVALPSNVNSGFYYLYVVADADDAVFEYLNKDNNLLQSSLISVTSPDLQITEMTAPEQITSGYPINLSYTLINNGDGAISNRSITDKIYISNTESLNGATQIAQTWHNVNLPVGQSMTVTCNATAPTGLTDGTFHLIVVADGNNEIHESNEGNNTLSQYPMPVMHQPLPDLQPVSFNLPSTIQAGEAVNVDFDITNLGDLDLLNSNCTFDVYALQNGYEILCPVQSQTLPLGSNVSIGIGQTVHFVRSILVPASVTSACTTFKLYADKENRVTESNESNNTIITNASVLDCPLPDLTVSNFTFPALQAGTDAQVSFTVSNQGTADFNGSFGTVVYANVNGTQIQCPLRQQIAPETTNYNLTIGESLQFTLKVLVPPTVTSACTSFSVKVDEANTVLETNENNNSANGNASVTNYPFNLTTQTFTVPSTVTAGETTNISWTVKNTGYCPNGQIPFYIRNGNGYSLVEGEYLSTPWKDRIYLSNDAILDNNDNQLLYVNHNTVLNPNGTYSVERTITLPYSAVGSRYLLCVSDAEQITFDNNRTDNVVAVPVTVELGVLPDLRITSLTVDEVMTCDRAYWVHYTVVNEGERVTQKNNWTDAFYIGEGMTYIGALEVGTKIHHGALEVGGSYTDSIEILIPNGLDGDYFLIGFTDRTNQIYENNNENDNVLATPVTVLAPDPCDLIVLQPEFPATVVSGEEMAVSWQLHNIGLNPAIGRIRNAVYLSTDTEWSSDDKMLGYGNIDINLVANAQQTCLLSGMLTSVPEGHYYVIVKANILNALNESSYENNICVSMLTTEVSYPILVIGGQVDRSLASDQYIYYKLEVGPEYEGQTLSCTLTTAEQQMANGLYLSHETVPTLAQYDLGQYAPYAQEIEVLIPALEQGNYYLLVKGSTQSGSPQQVSIASAIINFEILHIDADHGSNTGSITTKVTGAKFDSIMDFRLVQGGEYLPAEKVFFSNSTETYTTFDLVDMPAGTYAMEAELPGGIITIKGEAFTIEEGLPAELAVNIVAPSSVRRGNTFPVNIEYGNIGTTDLNVSGFVVVSRNGHPIGFTSDELAEGLTERVFSTAEANGNPDVLRPGYRATKTILVDANTLTQVSLQVYAIRKQY